MKWKNLKVWRMAARRIRKQREREALLLAYGSPDGSDLSLDIPGLPLPGRPWWRIKRRELGLPVPELPLQSQYARVPAGEIADRRKAKRDARKAAQR